MSTKCSPSLKPLDVELFPSLTLRALLAAQAVIAWTAIALSALPVVLQLSFGAAVAAYLVWLLRRYCGGWGGLACCGLRWDGASWWWRDRRGANGPLRLRGATLWPWCVVLDFRAADGSRRALALLPDSAAADDLRRLRIALRHADVFG